jgi:hypothetical protein
MTEIRREIQSRNFCSKTVIIEDQYIINNKFACWFVLTWHMVFPVCQRTVCDNFLKQKCSENIWI